MTVMLIVQRREKREKIEFVHVVPSVKLRGTLLALL